MTQEDKELLLKDICARLPYGVIIHVNGHEERVDEINPFEGIITCGFQSFSIDECKPYLRSMSSMTEEERNEYLSIKMQETERVALAEVYRPEAISEIMDWLNKHHFDYRGLIPKSLAISVNKNNNPHKE